MSEAEHRKARAHASTSLSMSAPDVQLKRGAHPERSRRMNGHGQHSMALDPGGRRGERKSEDLLIEGYASLFGIPDLSGDVVRAGAFARSLRSGAALPMLLQHRQGALAGCWTRLQEDGRGLFVRGLIGKASVARLVRGGLNGLSIGFRPRLWKPLTGGGRELIEVELVEVSLVETPMQTRARFAVLGMEARVA